jgi:hypothetical protein
VVQEVTGELQGNVQLPNASIICIGTATHGDGTVKGKEVLVPPGPNATRSPDAGPIDVSPRRRMKNYAHKSSGSGREPPATITSCC